MKILILTLAILMVSSVANADWQSDLEAQFDIVETFDQLQDWRGTKIGYVYDINDMPKKVDGSPSMWEHYYGNSQPVKTDWIRDQGVGYNWKSNKALCINIGPQQCEVDVDALTGWGPARLGTYFGDGTPESGYHEIYAFYMMKFHEGYWIVKEDGTYEYPAVQKSFDMITGFTSIDTYGATYCQTNQMEYGSNNILFNLFGGGSSTPTTLFFVETKPVSEYDSANDCYKYTRIRDGNQLRETQYQSQYEKNEWFGVEYRTSLGTLGNTDGDLEIWIYDEQGNVISHQAELNVEMQRLLAFNYNKILFGGNYLCDSSAHIGKVTETRIYYDDFIVDSQRIGPTYFAMLAGTGPTRTTILPTPIQPSGTTQITLQVNTDVNATCKYGADGVSNVDYATMANTMTGTALTHTATITGLSDGNNYSRDVRCTDGTDTNDTPYVVSWAVSSGSTPPSAQMSNFQIMNGMIQ